MLLHWRARACRLEQPDSDRPDPPSSTRLRSGSTTDRETPDGPCGSPPACDSSSAPLLPTTGRRGALHTNGPVHGHCPLLPPWHTATEPTKSADRSRIGRGSPLVSLDRTNRRVQGRQVQPFDVLPHDACPMILGQQRIERQVAHDNLVTLGTPQTRRPPRRSDFGLFDRAKVKKDTLGVRG